MKGQDSRIRGLSSENNNPPTTDSPQRANERAGGRRWKVEGGKRGARSVELGTKSSERGAKTGINYDW
jgi:hypothetical protein